ncbi:hypothetical protein [Evansella tamaricis]|uniref:Lipoprotein n=1 Tax=Evansella tamaricis TaxID=2069301 RepID=A0ABS6JGM5_9BACI|nr:hypothetical protein [Evansella tamaricis]MBU9712374.1 hypothetical protein [Evansella tamaricis]
MKNIISFAIIFFFLNLLGCTELGTGENQERRHLDYVYEAGEKHVTFPYSLPYFDDYTIVDLYFVPQDEADQTEEKLFVTYNADILITTDMEKAMLENSRELDPVDGTGGYRIYGPYFEENDVILPIQLDIKRSPFEVISPLKDRSELDRIEVDGKEILFDYEDSVMTSNGSLAYFIFEVERDGTYYRVFVEVTSKMTHEEVKDQIKELVYAFDE